MTGPSEHLKSLANRIAASASSADGARLVQLLEQSGLLGFRQDGQQPTPKPGTIGIWEPKTKNGRVSYVRSLETIADWPRWANIARIDPKRTRWRILFLGESVARGYLYEPFYTPAMVLQSLLEGVLGKGSVEVLDLARTDMATEIKELALSAAPLEPDAIVILAGNNWRAVDILSEGRRPEVDAILRSQGIAGLKQFAEDGLRLRAGGVVEEVRNFYCARKIPLVWAIPEFNLGDWQDWRTNAPHLPGSANSEWLVCCRHAEDALAREDFAAVQASAERMLELDQRTNSYTLALLARCRVQAGDLSGTRTYLQWALDAGLWDWSQPLSPRCLTVTREQIKAHGQCDSSAVVDLRELYCEYLEGALPDRRLFLDYCHLTVEGIRLTMAAVAARLAAPLAGRTIDWRTLFAGAPAPSAAIEAEGALLAAVHNAHWFQPQPVVQYFCSRALALSPHTANMMARFIEVQTTPTPALFSRPGERLSQLGGQAMQYLLGRNNIQQLDAVLLTSMACALEAIGQPAYQMLKRHWAAGHNASERAADLLDYYYLSSAGQPQDVFWATPPERGLREFATVDYYRAHWIESAFPFVAGGHQSVQFDLTCRIPDAEGPIEAIRVFVNEEPVADLPGERVWRRYTIEAAPGLLREGLNRLSVRWPARLGDQSSKLAAAADSLVHQPRRALFQIFGEIHSLTASPRAIGTGQANGKRKAF
jgi:hypothetical protein